MENKGVKIHYEVFGKGTPLVLQHGIMGSIRSWEITGWIRSLKDEFQLVVIDARGHGLSDKPRVPAAYEVRTLSSDVISVLDDLGLEKAHYFGYSFGGWIGYANAIYNQRRFHSLIIGGMHPFNHAKGSPERWIQLLKAEGMKSIVDELERTSGKLPKTVKEIFFSNDPRAIIAVLEEMLEENELYRHLGDIKLPVLIFAGNNDDMFPLIRRAADSIATARFVAFKELNHRTAFTRRDVVEPIVRDFLNSMNSTV